MVHADLPRRGGRRFQGMLMKCRWAVLEVKVRRALSFASENKRQRSLYEFLTSHLSKPTDSSSGRAYNSLLSNHTVS
jgi:hypothetical protein